MNQDTTLRIFNACSYCLLISAWMVAIQAGQVQGKFQVNTTLPLVRVRACPCVCVCHCVRELTTYTDLSMQACVFCLSRALNALANKFISLWQLVNR